MKYLQMILNRVQGEKNKEQSHSNCAQDKLISNTLFIYMLIISFWSYWKPENATTFYKMQTHKFSDVVCYYLSREIIRQNNKN